MIRRSLTCLLCLFVVSVLCATAAHSEETKFPIVWSVDTGLSAPESAYFDEDSGFLFLSQIGKGGGGAKDGDGWISKLTPDGKMVQNEWVKGLNAPKGLRSHGGTLWVSDIDRIVGIDIAIGKIIHDVMIPEAKFLNDLACGADGTVYVNDMTASRIYQYRDGKISVVAEGEELEHPNGLLVEGDHLILGGWGPDAKNAGSANPQGRLLRLDLESGKVTRITEEPQGNLDGVESDGEGGYYVTDWKAGKVLHISGKGETKTLMTFPQGAADLAYLPGRHLLILPRMMENKLTAFDMSP